jgi:hypothetical protein
MHKPCATFATLLLAVTLQLPGLSKTLMTQRNGLQPIPKQGIEAAEDGGAKSTRFDCLPEGFRLTDIVSYNEKGKGGRDHLTIRDKLIEMKAQCKDGKLLHKKGREIRFFKFSCFGNPPADYDEIAQKEREQLEKLQKDYTVIVVACDPRTN